MDPNLLYWQNHGQSFFSRLKTWFDLLDPLSLLSTDEEIQKARNLLGSGKILKEEDGHALNLSLSSVHADSGNILPIMYRPPALFLLSTPLVVASLLPHTKVMGALYWQSLQQVYFTGFNYINRNSSAERHKKASLENFLIFAGTVSFTTFAGAIPQVIINRLGIRSTSLQTFFRSALPVPLSAALAYFNVLAIRNKEIENGIKVFDSKGNAVGLSKAAGQKAVEETALSRAALFATTAAVPNFTFLLLNRTRFFQRNSRLAVPLRHMTVIIVFGLMIPISFSLFPQLGTIKKEHVEETLKAAAEDGQLYYHRGL